VITQHTAENTEDTTNPIVYDSKNPEYAEDNNENGYTIKEKENNMKARIMAEEEEMTQKLLFVGLFLVVTIAAVILTILSLRRYCRYYSTDRADVYVRSGILYRRLSTEIEHGD